MKANDEPRNAGTLPFETKWNSSVPRPANNSVAETDRPVSIGTRMRGAEHGEHVLQPEHRHLRLAELSCVVDRFRAVLSPIVGVDLLSLT